MRLSVASTVSFTCGRHKVGKALECRKRNQLAWHYSRHESLQIRVPHGHGMVVIPLKKTGYCNAESVSTYPGAVLVLHGCGLLFCTPAPTNSFQRSWCSIWPQMKWSSLPFRHPMQRCWKALREADPSTSQTGKRQRQKNEFGSIIRSDSLTVHGKGHERHLVVVVVSSVLISISHTPRNLSTLSSPPTRTTERAHDNECKYAVKEEHVQASDVV